MSSALQRRVWGILMIAVAGALFVRVWALQPLYVDAELRGSLRMALEHLSAEQGWLLSDIEIDSVTPERATLTYRPHFRGPDPKHCFVLVLASSSLAPCPDE